MKQLLHIHNSPPMHWVGNGFPVRSVFDYNSFGREISPFLLMDYAAPYRFAPGNERRGVGAHPHRGFETVTLAYQGEIEHRDSSGGGGLIGPDDVQWMTAAGGIVHQEYHADAFTRSGGVFEMVQLWVNLPARDKNAAPGYQTLTAAQIPVATLDNGAGTLRVVAGEYLGHKGPAHTFTPINLWELSLSEGAEVTLPLTEGHSLLAFVISGEVSFNEDDRSARQGDLAIFSTAGAKAGIRAGAESKVLVLSGEPIDEPIVGHGPFVMNSATEIQQAFRDYQLGRMGDING